MDSTVEDSINTSNASIGSSSTDIGDQGENNTVLPESSPATPQTPKSEVQPKEAKKVTIEESCNNMVEKIAEYLNGELSATSEDYKLLETLNKLTINKYDEMSTSTKTLITKMEEINEKYKLLSPYLTQIELLEESVLKLEQTAYKLDDYSKQLESKFKTLEKR